MAVFRTIDCEAQEVNFFTNPVYTRGSFSVAWDTRLIPDNDFDQTPVYIQVLNKFNIPINSEFLPACGQLPGLDIRNMPAIEAIKLSLAECLVRGEWWEIYEDGLGGVFFEQVFNNGLPGRTVSLDIRSCIPSATKSNDVDMVVVTGYDPPPQSYIKEFKDVVPQGTGTINPTSVDGDERVFTIHEPTLLGEMCHGRMMAQTAWKSYKDPVKDTQFGPQEPNPFYDVKAFEQIRAYVVDIDGMEASPRVKYTFSTTTPWFTEITLPAFQRVSKPSCALGLPEGPDIVYYESTLNYNIPYYSDRYGTPWPLINKPLGINYVGYVVDQVVAFSSDAIDVFVQPVPNLRDLAAGANWVWDIAGTRNFTISVFYKPSLPDSFTLADWEFVQDAVRNASRTFFTDVFPVSTNKSYVPVSQGGSGLISTGNGLGELMTKVWIQFELDRPCVVIQDAEYDALTYANSLRIRHAPLIVYDPPAPIAYYHKDFGRVIVDQTQDLVDSDPTTCQNFEQTDQQVMQDRMQGQVIQTQLPFCESAEVCATVAETIFRYMSHEDVQTYSLMCGPEDEPVLGAAVEGFDSNLRIESINYSYSDGSAYTVNVNLAPVFTSIGSWNNQSWLRRTEDVSRKGIVVWTAGDSTNYRVYVKGLGHYNAINATDMVFRVGEMVDVTIYNNPQEA